jgi:hypothetical protein
VRVASLVPFIIMKAIAISERPAGNEKDAYDLFYCLKYYPGGIDKIVKEFAPYNEKMIVKKALKNLKGKFQSVNDNGPKWIADFEEIEDKEERERIMRDSFEKVKDFLDKLGIK